MIHVQGMQGLGDNLHQRALIRQMIADGAVQLETPWPQIYHDLAGPRLNLVPRETGLRTQARNATLNRHWYGRRKPVREVRRVWYTGDQVRAHGSILGAMLVSAGLNRRGTDFTMPMRDEWRLELETDKPILFYRPLVERKEWNGCAHRNPDRNAYFSLLQHIRSRYHVVSVADLVPGVEWQTSLNIHADTEFHAGELPFEKLCGLMAASSAAFCSPGFALVLAQALGTPVICVFGGRESSSAYADGSVYTPTLGIDTLRPCNCFDHRHHCERRIDVQAALHAIDRFLCLAEPTRRRSVA